MGLCWHRITRRAVPAHQSRRLRRIRRGNRQGDGDPAEGSRGRGFTTGCGQLAPHNPAVSATISIAAGLVLITVSTALLVSHRDHTDRTGSIAPTRASSTLAATPTQPATPSPPSPPNPPPAVSSPASAAAPSASTQYVPPPPPAGPPPAGPPPAPPPSILHTTVTHPPVISAQPTHRPAFPNQG